MRGRPIRAIVAVVDWAEKHRPKSLDDVVGNARAVEELRAWAARWREGVPPDERAVILAGDPGVGKTSAALALARDMGWGVVELNASDSRNEEVIRRIAGSGAVNRAFRFDDAGALAEDNAGRQLVILDEADNLFGNEDRGGMKAIQDTIRNARQPIVLIANDYYELTRRGGSLKSLARTIKFTKVHSLSIPPALRRIAEAEGVALAPDAAKAIAERAGGDLRSAVNDLAAVAAGRSTVTLKEVEELGRRDATGDVWGLLGKVFYGRSLDEARKASWELDETPDTVALWIDENLPVFYQDRADLVEGYAMLTRADVYLGRALRRQQFGLWSYATTLMTGGVSVAKHKKPAGARFVFPSWLRKLSTSKAVRELRKRLALKVGEETHTSARVAFQEMFPLLQALMETDAAFAEWVTWRLDLDADELAFLLREKATSARVKALLAKAAERGPARARESAFAGLSDFEGGVGDDEDDAPVADAESEDGDDGTAATTATTAPPGAPPPVAKPARAAKPARTPSDAPAKPVGRGKAEKKDADAGKSASDPTRNKKLFDF